jgi:hypothetical protein
VLENKAGKRKLILPYGRVSPDHDTSGCFKTNIVIDRQDEESATLAFDLDAGLKPIAKTKEQKLYLASILFMQKQYQEVQALLRASFSHVLPFNNKELALLNRLCTLPIHARDLSPHAGALICTALSLLPEAEIRKFGEEENQETLLGLARGYMRYKKQQATIPYLKLLASEEEKAFSSLNTLIQNNQESEFRGIRNEFSTVQSGSDIHALYHTLSMREKPKERPTAKSLYAARSSAETWPLQTRPGLSLKTRFIELYTLALTDPAGLEISLATADQDDAADPYLITLLRGAAHAKKTEEKSNRGSFPSNLERMQEIIETGNEFAFSNLLDRAEKEEEIRLRTLEKMHEPVEVRGERKHKGSPLSAAQTIQMREQLAPAGLTPYAKTSKRAGMLTADQLPFKEIPFAGLHLEKEEIAQLQKAIMGDDPEKITPLAAERAKQIAAYWENPEHRLPGHRLDPAKISSTERLLRIEQAEMGKSLHGKEQELMDYANKLPLEEKETLLYAAEKMGKRRQEITLKDLRLFAARASHFTLTGKNPALAGKEKELLGKCIAYLEAQAQQQQLARAIKLVSDLKEVDPQEEDAYCRCSEKLYQELTRKPPYDAFENPELVVFEVSEEKGLYAWQKKDLDRMLRPKPGENPNVILEKVMGSGKSKVYLPNHALSKADGEHIAFIVVPASLFEETADAMEIQSGQQFGQVAHVFNFSRESDTSAYALDKIYQDLLRVQKERHFFVATDKSMHSLSLASDELWENYLKTGNADLLPRIDAMRKIVNLIKEKGRATLDEADLLLNCRSEVVYALGDPQPIKETHRNAVADLYQSIHSLLNELIPFTESAYYEMKQKMIDAYIQVVAKSMPGIDQKQIKSYLIGQKAIQRLPKEKAAEAEQLARAFKEGANYLDKLPEDQRNILSIAFYEFEELLPLVLGKRFGEHFGYSDRLEKILPVPFLANGVPSLTAEFSSPYVQMNYALLALRSEGISATLLRRLIHGLHVRALKEQKEDPSLSTQETKAYKEFLDLCGGEAAYRVTAPFFQVSTSDIKRIVNMYKQHPADMFQFAKRHLFPSATQHARKLTSTSFTLANMFEETQGFTGTPWNAPTYPSHLVTLRDPESAGKTEGIIWKNSPVVHNLSKTHYKDLVKEVCAIGSGYGAFIDTAAMFLGIANQEVAYTFLQQLPPTIQGVLFYIGNRAYVLERGKADPVRYDPERGTQNLFIYYDQQHTTGTDYAIQGKSFQSIGKNIFRDLEQGYMRDRKAGDGPRVEFVLTPEAAELIGKELNLPKNSPVGTAQVMRCFQHYQEKELEEQLVMASLGKMQNVLNQHLKRLQRNPAIRPETIRNYAKEILPLIGEETSDAPYELLGRWRESGDKEKVISALIEEAVKKFEPLLAIQEFSEKGFGGLTAAALRKELTDCIDLKLLPQKMSLASKTHPEQLSEQQSQMQTQQQSQQQRMAQKEQSTATRDKDVPKYGALRWNFRDNFGDIDDPLFYDFRRAYHDNRNRPSLDLEREELPNFKYREEYASEQVSENEPIYPESDRQTPFFWVSDVLGSFQQEYAQIFDIATSYNVMPEKCNILAKDKYDKISTKEGSFSFYDCFSTEPRNLLITKHDSFGETTVKATLLSHTDAGYFFKRLAELPKDRKRQMDVTLYHLDLKVLQSNSPDILSGKENILNERTLSLIVQAKFLNGESLYSKAEAEHLRSWIQKKGHKQMHALFEEILRVTKKKDEYYDSTLSRIFAELAEQKT